MTPASGRFRSPSTKAPASPLLRRRMKNSAQALGCRMCERPRTPNRMIAKTSTDLSIRSSLLPRLDNHRVVFASQRATVEIAVDLKTGKSGGPQQQRHFVFVDVAQAHL